MALSSLLPPPMQVLGNAGNQGNDNDDDELERAYHSMQVSNVGPPPLGRRRGWIPRSAHDFGDGGAFPEIHVAQFPNDMGRVRRTSGQATSLPVRLDASGRVKYDDLVRQSHRPDKVVHSKFTELVPVDVNEVADELQKPSEEEIQEITEKTRMALEAEVNSKIAAAQPTQVAQKQAPAQYIRYTPAQQGPAFNSGAKQRVIRMVEVQKDPIEPPRFKTNKKIPRGPPSPPAPVMHSPTRKVTVKEQQEWKIPPCISNWKNPKGYTIPLDKRLASDGRGLQDPHINDKFAKLAEALYIADRKAREAVDIRAQLERKHAQKEKEKKEENLRKLAQKAREERAGIKTGGGGTAKDRGEAERDELRHDRHRERERDRRIAKAGAEKRSKYQRDKDRDISEKIALGLPSSGNASHEALYDQRLFNQNKGMDSGFGAEDSYNVYDKPWRKQDAVSQMYRPSKSLDQENYGDDVESIVKSNRFVPDKEFAGTDHSRTRDGPVDFVKNEEEDPFELDKFLSAAKHGGKRPEGSSDRDYERGSKRSKH